MSAPTTRIAVVGGSIAGCAMALAAHRGTRAAGEVTVFERSAGQLQDRGVGVGIHNGLCRELLAAGYLDPRTPYLQLATRKWITSDGASYGGKVIGYQDFPFRAYNWGSLWQALRDRIPSDVEYRTSRVVSVAETPDDAVVTLAEGTDERFDVVLGADGYRSAVRSGMFPEVRPRYAGYLLWRGTLPVADLPEQDGLWEPHEAVGVAFPGGHLIMYLIPGRSGAPALNWALYSAPPEGIGPRWDDPAGLPRGGVDAALSDHFDSLGENMPPYWREMLARMPREEILAQPIYDLCVPACVTGRLALVGDAAAVVRPHTGRGAVKAVQDAVTMQSALSQGMDWPGALRSYDEQRAPVNRSLVELGRVLGDATVLDPPDWREMDQAGFGRWWADAIGRWT